MNILDWRSELDRYGHRVMLSGQPIAMHCHHYNINLQKTLEDALGGDGVDLLFRSAEEAVFRNFKHLLAQYGQIRTAKSKIEMASIMYQNCGLGVIHLKDVTIAGGGISSPSSHHVTGWLAKHGKRDTPGCHFSRGWIAGALEAIFDQPLGCYEVLEEQCKMMRAPECLFQVRRTGNGH